MNPLDTLFQAQTAIPVLAALADLTVKAALMLAAAGIVTSLMRKRPASVRHAVWLAAVTCVLVLPVLTAALPEWRVLPVGATFEETLASVPATPEPGFAAGLTEGLPADSEAALDVSEEAAPSETRDAGAEATPAAGAEETWAAGAEATPAAGAEETRDAGAEATPATEAAEGAAASSSPTRNAVLAAISNVWNSVRSLHWSVLLLGAWLLGVMVILGNHVVGAVGLFLVSRRAKPVLSQDWLDLAEEIGDRLWITREVSLLRSHVTTMPVTWGGRRPVVLLPSDADTWSDERRRYVLTHEFAHIRRWDCTTQGLAQLACAIYWFNPMVWVAARRLRVERERACDDQVLMAGGKASTYAEHLLDIARSLKATLASPLGAVAMARPSQLEGRVLAILDPDRRRKTFSRAQTASIMGVTFALVLPIAAMAPAGPVGQAPEAWTTESSTDTPSAMAWSDDEGETDENEGREREKQSRSNSITGFGEAGELPAVASRRPRVALPDTIDTQKRKVVDAFIKALGDEDAQIRRQAAHTLGELEDPRSIPALRQVMRNDQSTDVRRAALWALSEMDQDEVLPVLLEMVGNEQDAEARRQIAYMIGENAEDGNREAGQALMRLLGDSDAEVRATATWGLAEIEYVPALDAVLALTEDPDSEVRERAVWAVGELAEEAPSAKAVEALTRAIGSENAQVREMAAWALGELEDPAAIPALIRALRDDNAEVRQKAAWALGEIEDPQATSGLIPLLQDRNSEVRQSAAYALMEIDTPESLRALAGSVDDDNTNVRRQAMYALSELEDPESVAILERAAGDSDPQIRRTAIYALAELEDDRAAPALIRALEDSDAQIRRTAVYGLGELESPVGLEGLRKALRDSDSSVRRAAIHAVGEMEDRNSVSVLIEALSDGNAENRRAAAWALAEILEESPTDAAIDAITRMLREDASAENRKAAAYALGEFESPRAIDALRAALDDGDRDVRRAAANALSNIDWENDDDDDWDEDEDPDPDDDWDEDPDSDYDWDGDSDHDGDWDSAVNVRVNLEGIGATVGQAIGGITETALAVAGQAIDSIDLSGVFHSIEHELGQVDVDAMVDKIEVELSGVDAEIEIHLHSLLAEAFLSVAMEHPGSAEARAAKRALRRMNSKASKKALQQLEDCNCG